MPGTYFRVYSGLLTPEHQKKIGSALWTFLWLIDRVTEEINSEEGTIGKVLYDNPISYSKIGEDIGVGKSTVRRHCETLEKEDYISMKITPRGNIFNVKRSKKWSEIVGVSEENQKSTDENRAENGTMRAKNGTMRAENGTVKKTDRAEYGTMRAENGTVRAENEHSILNNNIKEQYKNINTTTTTNDIESESEIESVSNLSIEKSRDPNQEKVSILEEFVRLRGYGFQWSPDDERTAQELLDEGVSPEVVIQHMQECFRLYQPKHRRDRINRLSYCAGFILDRFVANTPHSATEESEQSDIGNEYVNLAERLLAAIVKNNDEFKNPDIQEWARQFKKIAEEDGRRVEALTRVIDWSQNHHFWKMHILSPKKIGEKFDQMVVQIKAEKESSAKPNHRRNQRVAPMPKWAAAEKQQEPQRSAESPSDESKTVDYKKRFEELLLESKKRKQTSALGSE